MTLTCSPEESVHLDFADLGLEGLHVGFVVPRLDVEQDRRLGDDGRLLGLLGGVGGYPLGLDALLLGLVLVVRAEQVHVIVVIGGGGRGGRRAARELGALVAVRADLGVPAQRVRQTGGRRALQRLKGDSVCL